MRASPSTALVGTCLLLIGCQTPGTDSFESVPAAKTGADHAKPVAYAIASSADLDDLVAAALQHHPSLRATQARIAALEQSAVQARALPDPTASAGTGRMAETAAGRVVGTVGLQQQIPFPGKRSARSLAALRRADAMRARLRTDRLALAERVRTTYWNYYTARRNVAVIAEAKSPLEALRASVEARIAASKASQQDLLRLGNEITRLDQRLAAARGREQAARESLNALLFRPSGSALPDPRAGAPRLLGSAPALLGKALQDHPEVAAAHARIAAAEQGVELARLAARPDFTAGLSYSPVADDGLAPSADGRDQFMGTLGVTIPLWKDKNLAARREAAATLGAERSELAATRSSLQQRVESAAATYAAEQRSFALYEGNLLPDARQSLELTLTGYQTDSAAFLDVIDAWRQLLNYQLEHAENRGRVGQAEAALLHASGLR